MTLNFKITRDVSIIGFGLAFDLEKKSLMFVAFYWCFSVTSIKLKKPINQIEVINPEIVK